MPEFEDLTPPNPTSGPTMPGYMRELAEKKAVENAEYWNKRLDEFFLADTVRDWVVGVVNNGNKWGIPASPPVYVPAAEKELFGWVPAIKNTGPKYTREDILIILDLEYQRQNNTTKSLWDMVGPEIRALCGLDNPNTPGKFGGPVGAVKGAYYLAPDDLPVPEQGTTRTVDGVTYTLTGGFIKYWKPVD